MNAFIELIYNVCSEATNVYEKKEVVRPFCAFL